ncbi:beta-ketoacyl synthase N-terminal-like domain-containing protein [Actinokineospora guangxiensis]|uniref:Beta-ketoacyl synthase N-terminal-like domain-containing protein n=1 Tax=Actinokineospora guangxiensis TaxID=1490288 RepID=A0ABW0ESU1_9PSEU
MPGSEPIAVTALACRLPGGIESPDALWRLLADGGDAIGPFPARWDGLDLRDAGVAAGGFLDGADRFDASFFGVSPLAAQAMEPERRIAIETVWEALERAGVGASPACAAPVGLYLGATGYPERRVAAGAHTDGLAARVAAALGLRGPELTVDTACSSSLVALHLAVSALRSGECAVAVAGGVTVMTTPAAYLDSPRGANAADGRCKSFSADADGAGWAEGCGVVVLKTLAAAIADGDDVLAVLRGSAVGEDQAAVIAAALADAALDPAEVDAVEAHGSGEPAADAAEAAALAAVHADRDRPLWIGSVKSNLGHTQAAAGVTGLIKVVLALREQTLPPTAHAARPSADLVGELRLLSGPVPWRRGTRPRRAGVSAFGMGGTGAHLVVEEAPSAPAPRVTDSDGFAYPVVLSGHDETAVRDLARAWAEHLACSDASVLDVAATAALHRTAFPVRACVTASTRAELVAGLRDLADGMVPADRAADGGLAVVFTGQGVQRLGTGRAPYSAFGVFADAFDAVCAEFDPGLAEDVCALVFGADGDPAAEALLHDPAVAQPALFAVQVALFRLWVSWGVLPSAVTGHAVGELSAAHVAGVLALPDAARLVTARGRLLAAHSGGAMAALPLTEADTISILSDVDVAVVAAGSPEETVVAGSEAAVLEVVDRMAELGVAVRRMAVSTANPVAGTMLAAYGAVVRSCPAAAPELPMVSAVTAEWMGPDLAPGAGVRDPGYWIDQLGGAVRFAEAIRVLEDAGIGGYLECGPGPVSTATVLACLPADSPSLFTASLRGPDETRDVLTALGALHVSGQEVDWAAVFDGRGARRADLPPPAFRRERYWLPAARSEGDLRPGSPEALPHPWLDAVTSTTDGQGHLFTGRLSLSTHPWLGDHCLFGSTVMPGAGLVELAAAAADQVGAAGIGELSLARPLVLPETGYLRLRVTLGAETDGLRPIAVYSQPEDAPDGWTLHAVGTVVTAWTDHEPGWTEIPDGVTVPASTVHRRLAEQGLVCGPAFHGLSEVVRVGTDTVFGVVRVPEQLEGDFDGVHPALLDAALHALAALRPGDGLLMPVSWRGVALYGASGTYLRFRLDLSDRGDHSVARLWVTDEEDLPVAYVDELGLRAVTEEQVRAGDPARHLYRVDSVPVAATAAVPVQAGSTWTLADLPALGSGPPPSRLVIEVPAPEIADVAAAVRLTAVGALDVLQNLVADPRLADTELVWVTRGGLAAAPVRGLVRAARAEHGTRLRLIDAPPGADIAAALSVADEPELVVRDGVVRAVRLARAVDPDAPPRPLGPAGTVLITDGTTELGRLLAQHLVRRYGVRHLVLTSPEGPFEPGAGAVVGALLDAGAQSVRVPRCDVANRADLERVLAGIDPRLPLHGVFHLAATGDNALLSEQTAERIDRVLAPRVAGALHLDAVTADMDLSAFVLFSSASGVLGAAGHAAHAAADTFLDALAEHRRARGLPGSSLAWGDWSSDPTPGTLTHPEAMRLLDAALARPDTHLVPAKLDLDRGPETPALLRSLARGD